MLILLSQLMSSSAMSCVLMTAGNVPQAVVSWDRTDITWDQTDVTWDAG